MTRKTKFAWESSAGPRLTRVFQESAGRFPDRTAIQTRHESVTYAELHDRSTRIARLLEGIERPFPRLGAVLGTRTVFTYAGVLGTLQSGAGYVPLNPRFPLARSLHMLEVSSAHTLVLDLGCESLGFELLTHVSRPMLVVVSDSSRVADVQARFPRHAIVGLGETEPLPAAAFSPVHEDSIAYLLFTSGSTGTPKGVMVSHRNVLHYLEQITSRYPFGHEDRFSQTFDLTFDLSVHDMFVCWASGGALCCPSPNDLMSPAKFIRDMQLSVWFSVPSIAALMGRLGQLKPASLPALRVSLFCGEALPVQLARQWQAAAPASVVENLYGPTEATIACTAHRCTAADVEGSTSPIGAPLPGLSAAVVGDRLQLLALDEVGELCIAGPQVSHGYWKDEAQTAEKFVSMPWHAGPDNRWYRTGDLALMTSEQVLHFKGRVDEQVKIRGYRVELLEIEQSLKMAAETSHAAVLAYPRNEFGPTGTTGFVCGSKIDPTEVMDRLRLRLPEYMVPQDVIYVEEMPLNSNGKVDKKALLATLESTNAKY